MPQHLRVEIINNDNQKLMLYFDAGDVKEIDKANLNDCDVYFKRSFCPNYILELHPEDKNKIHPLGLNYLIFPNKTDLPAIERYIHLSKSTKSAISGVIASIDSKNFLKHQPRLRNLHSLPRYSLPPKVLFMVTAYDPYDKTDRPKAKIEERTHNNETRANCVRMLRKELGPNFYGGFVHNKYTLKNYKDVLLDIPSNAIKANYLKILEEFPICIATTGLHGSIGWKFAEYVAFSRAIVSETLQYELPGRFRSDENYLTFTSPEECVEQSLKLLTNHELRSQLMANNAFYYQHYVRPDMLVFNALSTAMEKLRFKSH